MALWPASAAPDHTWITPITACYNRPFRSEDVIMAGHSAWKNIKHKKAANDKRRGKMWSKCARAIIVAARNGGGDPTGNLALRYAIDEARAVNMPKDTIEKAIKKGTGELGSESYESAVYEG